MKNRLSSPARNNSSRRKHADKKAGGANPGLLELVRLRVAQIHQCSASMEDHEEKLSVQGETRERLHQLEAWENSNLFNGRERAALGLCEKVSLQPGHPLPDYLIHEMEDFFSKEDILNLTLAIMAVNDWISFTANDAWPADDFIVPPKLGD